MMDLEKAPKKTNPAQAKTHKTYPQRAKAPGKTHAGRRGRRAFVPIYVAGAVIVLIGALLQYKFFPDGIDLHSASGSGAVAVVADIKASDTVQLNEIMTANKSSLQTEKGVTSDWIELRNAGAEPVNLEGWTIAKTADAEVMFTFPNHILAPGELVLVFADSVLQNTSGAIYHAPFSIAAAGDTLMLFNPKGTAVDTVNIPSLAKNAVYRRVDDVWEVSGEYTPLMDNTHENYLTLTETLVSSSVVINEIIASNAAYYPAEDGLYYDCIELFNQSSETVDISGWYLSDERAVPAKWRVPDGTTIPAGGYLVFFASGLDEGRHTNFKLSSEGEDVILSNEKGQLLGVVSYDLLQDDQAYSRLDDGSFTTDLSPTPGMANTA